MVELQLLFEAFKIKGRNNGRNTGTANVGAFADTPDLFTVFFGNLNISHSLGI